MATRVPTVSDLRVKLCYICREEERYDTSSDEPPRAWTHPCKCTLIAHESCLLKWIETSQGTTSRAPNALKCPQCGSEYELVSRETLMLKALNSGNKVFQKMGRLFTVFSAATVVGVVGSGFYILCTSYGAWAVRAFVGKEMFDTLLTDDPSNWPWTAFINLPLLPISLILSRFQTVSSMPPLIPILLVWPPAYPTGAQRRILSDHWLSSTDSDLSSHLLSPARSWPPSPVMFGLFVFPVVRIFYRHAFNRLYFWALGTQPAVPQTGRMGFQLNEGPFVIRIRANVQDGAGAPAGVDDVQNGQEAAPPAQVVAEARAAENQDPNAAAVAAAEHLIEVNAASLGRRIGGALLIPAISNLMGTLLFHLSKRSSLLRMFLGVRNRPMGSSLVDTLPFSYKREMENANFLKQFSLGLKLATSALWGNSRVWAEQDPVWWRNSIGLGLFVVAKDCIQLLHLYLAKRELESRHVKNRDFAGVDIRELDLIPSFPRPPQ
ncbi:hypothetical protein BDQ12DRAFT_243456 [Crucibulum laeve]|uniref:RING-CH-type domain-containing protein n=1 Tax=Crucibulum laeve TaxID=68775 RepID=A0A5C3LVD6_9AGAR|nr:hypothetical protein BDQ12DRAFT_243456 [Crucibulum laeve]